ncbi:DEAD/DEAH box helicase [Candidatus Gracilibacteria bacterium]|nr:DEAD/DEAH box helicase [Candidatus Gracilibacteria bacterium]
MKLNLSHTLQAGTHYSDHDNIFAKVSLLHEQGGVLIVPDQKTLKKYQKLFLSFGKHLEQIDSLADLQGLERSVEMMVSTSDIFFLKFQEFPEISVKKGTEYTLESLRNELIEFGYEYASYIEPGNFSISGDTLTIRPGNAHAVYKINFWGDEIENIFVTRKNNDDMQEMDEVVFGKYTRFDFEQIGTQINPKITEKLQTAPYIFLDNIDSVCDISEVHKLLPQGIYFDTFHAISFPQVSLEIKALQIPDIESFHEKLKDFDTKNISIISRNTRGVENFLSYNDISGISLQKTDLNFLKSFETANTLVLCDDVLSRIFIKKRSKKSLSKNLDLLLQIQPGDYIVHKDHGIGIFHEIIEKQLGKNKNEYLEIHYKNNDKIFVPIHEVGRVNKYIGEEHPTLTSLGGNSWEKKLNKVDQDVAKIAEELLTTYAKRKMQAGFAHGRHAEERIFQDSFEYTYTSDQLTIIEDITQDMEQPYPMERLVCGDVGFGKTEIAFCALYKAILSGTQGVLISPLLVLAYEHYQKALTRFSDTGIRIELLTRMQSPTQVKNILGDLKKGNIDLVIGTHRLLSEDIVYKKLGLLVIDEEHKFGVADKEKIKGYTQSHVGQNYGVDILSLSATPIPRSLNLALSGVKSISLLTTPPYGRKSVSTLVSQFDDDLIQQAGKRELDRGGQIFFIHNEVRSIDSMAGHLQKLFPKKTIGVAHGQLPGSVLENRILDFRQKKYDILLATTVIENGIDFPDSNTIFINNAHKFGISNIHQLRGRVGRSDIQGYCYLLIRKDRIADEGAKRLQTLVQYSHLGAGFDLAMKDLEIRGGGDILGIRQSGQSKEIGINLYLQMLEDKIEFLKKHIDDTPEEKNQGKPAIEARIDLNISAYIDNHVFQSELDKINFYREIENIDSLEELESMQRDFRSMSPELSAPTQNFFDLLTAKILAQNVGIIHIKKAGVNYQIDFHESITIPELQNFLSEDHKAYFAVITPHRLRTPTKHFENPQKFLQYFLHVLQKKGKKSKMKLKRTP